MENKSYYISKNKKKKEVVYFEYDKVSGYEVNPKAKKNDEIDVSKIVFVNEEITTKIIRKKIDCKINKLLLFLQKIDEDDDGDIGGIQRNLMNCEKLRLQIINNYIKYLGHTYESLTLKKIQLVENQLRFKLYELMEKEEKYDNVKESRRGR